MGHDWLKWIFDCHGLIFCGDGLSIAVFCSNYSPSLHFSVLTSFRCCQVFPRLNDIAFVTCKSPSAVSSSEKYYGSFHLYLVWFCGDGTRWGLFGFHRLDHLPIAKPDCSVQQFAFVTKECGKKILLRIFGGIFDHLSLPAFWPLAVKRFIGPFAFNVCNVSGIVFDPIRLAVFDFPL